MINTIITDFSRVILNPKDKNYKDTVNGLYKTLKQKNPLLNFFEYFEFDDEVLNLYSSLKDKYSLNIFTTGGIQKAPEVQSKIAGIFENVFSAEDLGVEKDQAKTYKLLSDKLQTRPEDILYIDDQIKNIEAAKEAGMTTTLFQNIEQLTSELKKFTP